LFRTPDKNCCEELHGSQPSNANLLISTPSEWSYFSVISKITVRVFVWPSHLP
jgi:hypothetical protein